MVFTPDDSGRAIASSQVKPSWKVGDGLLEGELEAAEGVGEVGRVDLAPPSPDDGEDQRDVERDVDDAGGLPE